MNTRRAPQAMGRSWPCVRDVHYWYVLGGGTPAPDALCLCGSAKWEARQILPGLLPPAEAWWNGERRT
jgi:hypothetical protein